MRFKPRQGFRSIHDALKGAPGGILKRFFLKPLRRVLQQFAKALVTGSVLKSISNPWGRPPLPSKVNDALGVGLAEPRRSIKDDAHLFVGRVALSINRGRAFNCPYRAPREESGREVRRGFGGPGRYSGRGRRSGSTTLQYRCQVECQSTGITTARPTKSGSEPITSAKATISPHSAIAIGFLRTALTEV
jgi:hypothetical protein